MDAPSLAKIIKDAFDLKKDFLILEYDAYFAQIAIMPDHFWVEICSNSFLPPDKQISAENDAKIESLGFIGAEDSNYCKSFSFAENIFDEVSAQVLSIFQQFFAIPPAAEINIDIG